MIVAKRFFVSGRVQGVGFRFFIQDHAAAEGVHGYVQNLADGRVEAFVEGDERLDPAVGKIQIGRAHV